MGAPVSNWAVQSKWCRKLALLGHRHLFAAGLLEALRALGANLEVAIGEE